MKIGANDIRVGNILEYEKGLWVVHKTSHTQPGKGGAFMQVEMKELTAGTKKNVRFRSTESVEKARLHQVELQYLYDEGDSIALMNQKNFEQISVSKTLLNGKDIFLEEGMVLILDSYDEKHIALHLPSTLNVVVSEADTVVKGQTAASSFKPAKLENGTRIMVPTFIEAGHKIVIKSDTLEYIERQK